MGETWEPLPNWAKFFVEVGGKVAANRSKDHLIAVVTVPTREFAAALVAFGAVMRLSAKPPNQLRGQEYFDYLARLPEGTPVTLRDGDRQKIGVLRGVDHDDGQARIIVQVQKAHSGGLRQLLPVGMCEQVSVRPGADAKLSGSARGLRIRGVSGFLRTVLDSDPYSFASESRLDCLLIGNVKVLREELTSPCFSVKAQVGTLQELVRCRRFGSASAHYRSDVQSAVTDGTSGRRSLATPSVVVFDGASAYLRCRHLYKGSRWVVVLDRSSKNAQDAVGAIEQNFIQSRRNDVDPLRALFPAAGIEILAYTARRP